MGGSKDKSPLAFQGTLHAGTRPGVSASTDGNGPDPLLGTVLDRYRIIHKIGVGGMGTVYEAQHIELEKRCAVKVLREELSSMAELVERFRREARAASKIGNPHIVDVTDFGRTPEGRVYIVMEYLEGLDLADVLANEQTLTLERAVKIARQIARGLLAAHTADIVHRDLKPENVFLVTREGEPDFVKIVDFGIAKAVGTEAAGERRLTKTGILMGTPEYMAPEQVAEEGFDHRVDVYALGVILFEMIVGGAPHHGTTAEILTRKLIEDPPMHELPPEVPTSLQEVIRRALARNPAERLQSMKEFEEALTACLEEVPPREVVTPPADPTEFTGGTPTEFTGGTPGTRTAVRILILVAVLVILGTGVLYVVLPRIWGSRTDAPPPRAELPPVVKASPELHRPPKVVPGLRPRHVEPREAPRSAAPLPRPRPRVAAPPAVGQAAANDAGGTTTDGARLVREGEAHLRNGRFDAARDAFRKATTDPGARGAAFAGLAQVAFQDEKFDEAVSFAERAVRAGNQRAQIIIGNAYFKQGRHQDAARVYEAILARDPGNREAARNLVEAQKLFNE